MGPQHSRPGSLLLTQDEWRLQLSYLVYEGLCGIRIGQMFDIIVDYPDSLPAVRDVASCLQFTSLHTRLAEGLK